MIHYCSQDGFVCSQLSPSCYLALEAQFSFEITRPAVNWSAEVCSNVAFCPFCGFKAKNVEDRRENQGSLA